MVENLPAMWETWVQSMSGEDSLENDSHFFIYLFIYISSHSIILALRISWTEKPGGLQSMGYQRVGHD